MRTDGQIIFVHTSIISMRRIVDTYKITNNEEVCALIKYSLEAQKCSRLLGIVFFIYCYVTQYWINWRK